MIWVDRLRRRVQGLGPYPSLALLAVPVAAVEGAKLLAVLIFGTGHWLTGTLVIVGAYALSLLVEERLFRLVKPNLLRLPWFAAIWGWITTLGRKTLAWFGFGGRFNRRANSAGRSDDLDYVNSRTQASRIANAVTSPHRNKQSIRMF